MIDQRTIDSLQMNQIIEEIKQRAIGNYTKKRIDSLTPATGLETVRSRQQETNEARLILESSQHVPFMGLVQVDRLLVQIKKGFILLPEELLEFADFLRSNRLIRNFFEKNQYQTPLLYRYTQGLAGFLTIEEAIYGQIQNRRVADDASRSLRKIRRQLAEWEKEVEEKLRKFLRHPHNRVMLQENLIVKKGEHYTIPIKAAYKNKVSGAIIEQSGNGQTAFIEPAAVAKLNEQIMLKKAEETAEEYQILAELTGMLCEQEAAIEQALEIISTLDLIFARGKYSRELNGITPTVNKEERICIRQGRHPFLTQKAVPLDFVLGEDYRGLVITGANAGGKTLVLKTVGLLTLMTMFGLQIPAEAGTEIAVIDQLFVDIGDQQNLANALSTFSGHLKNISEILRQTKRHTLVLLDEIGSGTEPNEGAALAVAIMEDLYQKGALVVATTHYGEIKQFAAEHEDFVPAAMAFDRETLTPQFQLQVGQVGDSQALWIAQKMALPQAVIRQASAYIENKDYGKVKKVFKQLPTNNRPQLTPLPEAERFKQGDRVYLTENKLAAIVYQDTGEQDILVLVKEELQQISRRRVRFLMAAEQLYPADYDLESLFVDFKTRKMARDIERGSKKARKALAKEANARREKQQIE